MKPIIIILYFTIDECEYRYNRYIHKHNAKLLVIFFLIKNDKGKGNLKDNLI